MRRWARMVKEWVMRPPAYSPLADVRGTDAAVGGAGIYMRAGSKSSALDALFSLSWTGLRLGQEAQMDRAVQAAIARDLPERAALVRAYTAALAVNRFGGHVEELRLAADGLSSGTGERVAAIPPHVAFAADQAKERYETYLKAFDLTDPTERRIAKKVETELGHQLLQLKMRLGNPGWGSVNVVATSGMAGSAIESRKLH